MRELNLEQKLKEVGSHTLIYGLGSIAQTFGAFLLIPLLTSFLNPEEYGVFSLVQMAGTIAAAIFYLGITSALPRSYFDVTDPNRKNQIFSTSLFLLAFGLLLQVALGYCGQTLLAEVLLGDQSYSEVIFWSLLSSALTFFNQGFYTLLRLEKKSVQYISFSFLNLIFLFPIVYLLLEVLNFALLAPFVGVALTQSIQLILFIMIYGRSRLTLHIKKGDAKLLVSFGTPIILANFALMSIDWADRIFLEHFKTLGDVGRYSLGYRLGSLINAIFVTPFSQIWNPLMMEYRHHSNFKSFSSKIITYYLFIGGIIGIGAILFSQYLFPLFARSRGYEEAEPISWIILYSYFMYGLSNIVVAGLFFARKTGKLALITYIVAGLNILLNFSLVPDYGVWGASASTAFSYTLIPLLMIVVSRPYFSFDFEYLKIAKIFILQSSSLVILLVIYHNLDFLFRLFFFLSYLWVSYLWILDESEKRFIRKVSQYFVRKKLSSGK